MLMGREEIAWNPPGSYWGGAGFTGGYESALYPSILPKGTLVSLTC